MPWINQSLNEQLESRPTRIRLADGTTRTHEEVTDLLLESTGWVWSEPTPEITEDVTTATTATSVLI